MNKYLNLFFFIGFIASCNVKNETESAKYTYRFETNGCPSGGTGEQSFSSFDSYCSGLKNESLNKSCAREMRREQYIAANCPGDFDSGN